MTISVRLPSPARIPIRTLLLTTAVLVGCRPEADTQPPDDAGVQAATTQSPATEPPATEPVIDGARMLADVQHLASDALRGRYTFSDDLGAAADYIAGQYEAMGIGPAGDAYRVPFSLPHGSEPGDALTMWHEDTTGSTQVAGKVIHTLANGSGEAAYAEAVAIARADRAKAAAVRGKVVVMPSPTGDAIVEAAERLASLEAKGVVMIGPEPGQSEDGEPSQSEVPDVEAIRSQLHGLSIPVAWLDAEAARTWLGGATIGPKGMPTISRGTKLSMAAKQVPVMEDAFNVVAVLPGTTKPQELIVLGAHYDHIGTTEAGVMCRADGEDTICNGADDNASGTAMVLEIARAFTDAHVRPERTIVFAHFAGEELGLHGSKALAAEPPAVAPFEGGTVVAMVNLDMVGRLGEEGLAIGGVGSSDQWMPLLDELGERGLTMVYERAINSRSDHASYYRKKVPVLFFFTGLHDDYHKATDHFEAINREGMATIGQLVGDVVLRLAQGYEIAYAPPRNDQEGVVSRMPGKDDATVEKRACPNCTVESEDERNGKGEGKGEGEAKAPDGAR